MNPTIRNYLFAVAVIFGITSGLRAQTIRIMPLGNSITFDENSLDASYPRDDGVRISYRYRLYQLLHDAGYEFDYVGSENCGNNYFFNPELDDNAGFPGIETHQLEDLINTGYNAVYGYNESPGPYLNTYPADIILLHIGTNNLITSANQVDDLLDAIRSYDPDVFILVARIINRRTSHSSTTVFNNNVESMVNSRNDLRIRMVNMETGAGINYATDMIDNLHPNAAGYDKMGYKWFEALQSLNQPPSLTEFPQQFTGIGAPFVPISLDDYVNDMEDPAQALTWSYTTKLGSQLIVSIDENRNLLVSPNGGWSGTEVLTLKVTDTGNGVFPASSTIEVLFTVNPGNRPPAIQTFPGTVINQEEAYSYTIHAIDIDEDPVYYSVVEKPSWLSFNQGTHQLSGIPHDQHVGLHPITLRASDGQDYTDQSWVLEVIDVNDPPVFVSVPETEVDHGNLYSYVISATDTESDPLEYSILELPVWLQYNSITRVISGTPDFDQIGLHDIVIQVSDGFTEVLQSYELSVIDSNDPPQFLTTAVTDVNEDGNYYYNVIAIDNDGDFLNYSAPQIPEWLSFDPFSRSLIGQPGNDEVGAYDVTIRVTDGYVNTDQEFQLTVHNVNDPPVFISDPLINANVLEAYIYMIFAEDIDPGDNLTFSAIVKPNWLTLSSGTGDALLFGTPNESHIGSHAVIIQASDGKEQVMQGFTLKVSLSTGLDDFSFDEKLKVYPNPSDGIFYFESEEPGEIMLNIYNSVGILQRTISSDFEEQVEINISDFEKGIYIYKAFLNGQEETGKLIKN